MAFSGMPFDGPAGETTIVEPPAAWMAAKPREPSARAPLSTMPTILELVWAATDRNRRSAVRPR